MEDNHYKVDKLQVLEQQLQQGNEAFAIIEKNCEAAPVSFLKENYNNEKVRDRKHKPNFKFTVSAMLTKICALAGIKSEVDQFNADDINKLILSACNDLTLEEIYKAFELERYGSYDDKTEHFNLFNADYVATVIKKYRAWKQNTKIQHNISPPLELPQQTDSDKLEIINKGIIRVFNEFKETGVLPEPNNYIFDELYDRQLIRDAKTEKEAMYYQMRLADAKEQLEKEMLLDAKFNSDSKERKEMKIDFEQINKGKSEKILIRCKKLVLADYFNKLIKEGADINKIIANNPPNELSNL